MKYLRYLLLGALLFSSGYLVSAEIESLDTTDASNTARFPEGMAPSAVNNGARALEGIVARFHEDLGCRKSTTGSTNAYVFAPARAITYYDGLLLCFDANFQNTGSATLNANSKGAAALKRNGADIAAGTIETGQKVLVVYDGTNFEILSVARGVTTYTDPVTTRGDIVRGDSSGNVERLALGNTDEIIQSDGSDVVWVAVTTYAAAAADMEAATAITAYTSPGRQERHPSAAKAWVYFEGDAATPDSTKVGYNIGTIVDNGTGSYTIPFVIDQSTATYPVAVNGPTTATGVDLQDAAGVAAVDLATGSFRIDIESSGGAQYDSGEVSAIVMGDL
jgi:hypothetical protein